MDALTKLIEHFCCKLVEDKAVLQEFLAKHTVDLPPDEEREVTLFLENLSEPDPFEDILRDAESRFLDNLWSPPPAFEHHSEAAQQNLTPPNQNLLRAQHVNNNVLIHPLVCDENLTLSDHWPVDHYEAKYNYNVLETIPNKVVSSLLQEANLYARLSECLGESRIQQRSNKSRQKMLQCRRVQQNLLQAEPWKHQEIVETFLKVHNLNQIRHIDSISQTDQGSSDLDDKYHLEKGVSTNVITKSSSLGGNGSIQGFALLEESFSQKLGSTATEEKSGSEHQRTSSKELDVIDISQEVDRLLIEEANLHDAINMLQNTQHCFEANLLQELFELVDSQSPDDMSDKIADSCSHPDLYQADLQTQFIAFDKCFNPIHQHNIVQEELPANFLDGGDWHHPLEKLQTKFLRESSLHLNSCITNELLLQVVSRQFEMSEKAEIEVNLRENIYELVDRHSQRELYGDSNMSLLLWDCFPDQLSSSLQQQPKKVSDSVDTSMPMSISPRKYRPPPDILRILLPKPMKKLKESLDEPQQGALPMSQVDGKQECGRINVQPIKQATPKRIHGRTERFDMPAGAQVCLAPESLGKIECLSLNTSEQELVLETGRANLLENNKRLELHLESYHSDNVVRRVEDTAKKTTELHTSFKEPCKDDITSMSTEATTIEKMRELPSPTRSVDPDIIREGVGCSETFEGPRELLQEPQSTRVRALSPVVDPSCLKDLLRRSLLSAREQVFPAQPKPVSKVGLNPVPENFTQTGAGLPQQSHMPLPTHLNTLRSFHLNVLLEMHRLMNPSQVCGLDDLVLLPRDFDVLHELHLRNTSQAPESNKTSGDLSTTIICTSKAPRLCQFHEPSGSLNISVFGMLVLAGGFFIVETLGRILWHERNFSAADT